MCFCMKKKIGSVACSSVKTTNFVRAYRFIVVINIDSFEIYINSSKHYVSRKHCEYKSVAACVCACSAYSAANQHKA